MTLDAGETRTVRFTPDEFHRASRPEPRAVVAAADGRAGAAFISPCTFRSAAVISDSASIRFGIREITSEIDPQGHRLFRVNGKRILIRGGGWAPDMLLRESPERLKTQFRYLRDLNLNAIRLEGHTEIDAFFDLADEQGILVMAGWTCCDYWEQWTDWKPSDIEIATASLRSQILRLRAIPACSRGSTAATSLRPRSSSVRFSPCSRISTGRIPSFVRIGKRHAAHRPLRRENARPLRLHAARLLARGHVEIRRRVWLRHGNFAGRGRCRRFRAFGKCCPRSTSFPDDPVWNYHAGSERFQNLQSFRRGDERDLRRHPPTSPTTSAKRRPWPTTPSAPCSRPTRATNTTSTGVIQWMLNNAWPSLIWHLYDYYLQPAGGYFGAKKACEPLHVHVFLRRPQRRGGEQHLPARVDGLDVTAKLFDSQLHERFSVTVPVDVPADGVAKAGAFPERAFDPASPIYFVDLVLKDNFGKVLSTNFYWLSAKKNLYDWAADDNDAFTPVKSYEDLTRAQLAAERR